MFIFGDPGGRMYTSIGTSGANILAYWTSSINIAAWSVSAGNGRTTGSCLRVPNTGGGGGNWLQKGFAGQQIVGAAFGFRISLVPANVLPIVAFIDASTTQMDLRVGLDGSLSLTRNGTILATTAAGIISQNIYNHIEVKFKIASGTSGTYDLWLNGVNRLTSSAANTQATANASANVFQIGPALSAGGSYNCDYDDIIVYDGQATDANGFPDITGPIGDCGLVWLLPTGAGTTTQWTPDTGSNYARVNEATPDGDTSYVSDANVGDIDTYAMADLPANITAVKSVAVCHYARKTDTASRSIAAELRSGGTNYSHAAPVSLPTNYLYDFSNWGANPNTSAAWTVAGVNALEVGQKIAS
jgi:hypothetical protein